MDSSGSDDYELIPKGELDTLRRDVSALKKNSVNDGDKIKILIDTMDRLTISVNRLITILDDAEKDIIDEYQKSKPTEKLTQLLDQNELIARALIAISDNFSANNPREVISPSLPSTMSVAPTPRPPQMNRSILPIPMNTMNNTSSINNINSLSDDLPPMDTMPPLNDPIPPGPKKKFLGMM